MFAHRFATLRSDIGLIKQCLSATKALRDLSQSSLGKHTIEPAVCPFEEATKRFPNSVGWRVFDHCAAITRLYAVYERFTIDLLASWLLALPALFPSYSSLPPQIRKQHCIGVAQILPKVGEGRYSHLSTASVIESLNACLNGAIPYSLQLEPFLVSDQNLRHNTLEQMFGRAGLQNCWSWVQNHAKTVNFLANELGGSETAESELKALIDYRNEAAHGEVQDVLDVSNLNQFADFVQILCEVLAEWIYSNQLHRELQNGTATEVGTVVDSYPHKNVVVARATVGTFSLGDELSAYGKNYCFTVKVIDLQVNGNTVESVDAQLVSEIGIKFEQPIKENAKLVRRSTP
jgi:hypothetical protein